MPLAAATESHVLQRGHITVEHASEMKRWSARSRGTHVMAMQESDGMAGPATGQPQMRCTVLAKGGKAIR